MVEYNINIKETCGKNIVSRGDGKKVYDLLMQKWNDADKITVDFGNVLIASVSFIDEIFGTLAFTYSRDELTKRIRVRNIQEFDRALLKDILSSRFRQKELEVHER